MVTCLEIDLPHFGYSFHAFVSLKSEKCEPRPQNVSKRTGSGRCIKQRNWTEVQYYDNAVYFISVYFVRSVRALFELFYGGTETVKT